MAFKPLFILCIVARVGIAIAAAHATEERKWLRFVLACMLTSIAVAWMAMTFGLVTRDTGREAGGKIWWKPLRLVHALIYLTAVATMLANQTALAAALLMTDIAIGTSATLFWRVGRRN